jgi:hypothetical protein
MSPDRRADSQSPPAPAEEDEPHLALVLCRAGWARVGFEASLVRQAAVAGAAKLVTLEARLGMATDPRLPRLRLLLKGARGDWGLEVAGPLELGCLPASRIHPLPPLVAARLPLPGLRAFGLEPGGRQEALILLLDPLRLASQGGDNSLE